MVEYKGVLVNETGEIFNVGELVEFRFKDGEGLNGRISEITVVGGLEEVIIDISSKFSSQFLRFKLKDIEKLIKMEVVE